MPKARNVGSVMSNTFQRRSARAALGAIAVVATVALLGGTVRTLPLLIDPNIPTSAAWLFARAVAVLALEVAIGLGWPVGWSLALATLVERGEARAYQTLGTSPAELAGKLSLQGLAIAAVLFGVSWSAALDAERPGRVLADLVVASRSACESEGALAARAIPIPFLSAHWLCSPGVPPRLYMPLPRPEGALATATSLYVSPDVRSVRLTGANVEMGRASLKVGELELKRLPPLVASATIGPLGRAASISAATLVASWGVAWLVLNLAIDRRLWAISLAGTAGLAGFGALRGLDRLGVGDRPWLLGLVPVATLTALALGALLVVGLRRIRATATS